jgi:ribonuclease J
MTKLTFYGGVDEIGGNKILLEDKGTKIFLDFGMQMGKVNDYFAEFLRPRNLSGLGDLFEFNLLPKIKGIYRKDFSQHMGYGDHKQENAIDGVILSHAHVDHCAYIHYLRPDIPIYCSEPSYLIMKCFQDTGGDEQYVTYKANFQIYENKNGKMSRAKTKDHRTESQRDIRIIKSKKEQKIDSISVEPIQIDHSLPGVYGFLIHTSEGDIGYTADIRFHGRRPKESQEFVDVCGSDNLDYMLCEGTRIDTNHTKTEFDVERKAKDIISKTKNLVTCTYPTRDLDRFLSFYNAAKDTGRQLVIDTKQAYLLKLFQESSVHRNDFPSPMDNNLKVFVARKSWGLLGREKDSDVWTKNLIRQDYNKWERKFLDYTNMVDYADVSKHQRDYVFYCSDFQLLNLVDIRPKEHSSYIRSSTEPFDYEMALDQKRVKRWLTHFGLITKEDNWNPIHVSGHGTRNQIKDVIDGSNPHTLIPIHTQKARAFHNIHNKVRLVSQDETITV